MDRWIEVTDPMPGDLAYHRSGRLDPRVVTRVDRLGVWIDILGTQAGPFLKAQYIYKRQIAALEKEKN